MSLLLAVCGSNSLAQLTPHGRFTLFDATLYKDRPDLSQFGIPRLKMLYSGSFGGKVTTVAEAKTRNLANQISHMDLVVIDIEHWCIDTMKCSKAEATANINKFLRMIEIFREESPNTKIGFYGLMPVREYWAPVNGGEKEKSWKAANDFMARLADKVDLIVPSLYTFYNNQEQWVTYAQANITEAKQYGKPVYAVLWPQYHDSNKQLRYKWIPGDYWRLQLETVRKYADAAIFWGTPATSWDNSAEWWIATKTFLANGDSSVNRDKPVAAANRSHSGGHTRPLGSAQDSD